MVFSNSLLKNDFYTSYFLLPCLSKSISCISGGKKSSSIRKTQRKIQKGDLNYCSIRTMKRCIHNLEKYIELAAFNALRATIF